MKICVKWMFFYIKQRLENKEAGTHYPTIKKMSRQFSTQWEADRIYLLWYCIATHQKHQTTNTVIKVQLNKKKKKKEKVK